MGVLPDDFELTGTSARMWRLKAGSSTDSGIGEHGGTRAIARLAAGITVEQARSEVERILQGSLPPEHGLHGASVFPRKTEETRAVRPVLFGLLIAAGLLLVVACGNVAALLLGAGIDRERELAVRGAVGASRTRIVQQLLSESTMLALVGALGGIGFAALGVKALVFLAPPGVPRLEDAALNPTALAFAIGLALVCGIGFGSIPALSLSSLDLASAIGSTRTTSGKRTRLQSTLVVGELALATVLIVAGGLLGRTVSALNGVDPGFDHERLVVASIATPYQRFNTGDDEADRAALDQYVQQMVDEVRSIPSVTAVAVSRVPPFFNLRGNNDVHPEGWPDRDSAPFAERRLVSVGYFEALGIPIVEGRAFDATDNDPGVTPTVIVSEGLADLAWLGESALSKRLEYWGKDAVVVGVAAKIRDEELQRVTELSFYAPARQNGALQGPFLIRTSGDPAAVTLTLVAVALPLFAALAAAAPARRATKVDPLVALKTE